jgi:sugar/nucleoside kinase (ribokinase family)
MKKYHVYAIGNALVDFEFEVSDKFLSDHAVAKGGMTLVDEVKQDALLNSVGGTPLKRQCGGSAANTVIAVSQMGGKCFYSCKVANDTTGDFYLNDLSESGVETNLSTQQRAFGITGKCLVLITPDAERSMLTFLGITSLISTHELSEEAIKQSEYVYLEGYLAASPTGHQAAYNARELARKHQIKTAMTFSDVSMVKFFKKELDLMMGGGIDLLFCNESEAMAYVGTHQLSVAREELKKIAKTFVITRGENGAVIFDGDTFIDIEPYPVKALDTNGAGDMFAGAFLYGITHGQSYAASGKLASLASSKVVTQYGPRLKWHQTQEIVQQLFKK